MNRSLILSLRALTMGAIAGMRSLTAPALLSLAESRQKMPAHDPIEQSFVEKLASPRVTTALGVMALGEMVVDKLPMTPSRTQLPSVVFRTLSGAVVGSVLFDAEEQNPLAGAAVGAVGALAATFGLYHLRKATGEKLKVADPLLGMAEDALAIGSGLGVLASLQSGKT